MRLSDHSEVRRALTLLGVPVDELREIEVMRLGPEAEAALEKFKVRIAAAFKAAVRTEHHPDHGNDAADRERRTVDFRLIRSFSNSVKTWKSRSAPDQKAPDMAAMHSAMRAAMDELFRQMQTAWTPRVDWTRPVVFTRRSTFHASPPGTEVESRSTPFGDRVHRVRKRWKP